MPLISSDPNSWKSKSSGYYNHNDWKTSSSKYNGWKSKSSKHGIYDDRLKHFIHGENISYRECVIL